MAFKSLKSYNESRFGDLFLLSDDGDYADVVFLYKSFDDVLVADVHYINSSEYSGYVHCCGSGCPACAKGLRVQTRLFIPMYNLNTNKIEFFDRSSRFANQLQRDVFSKFADPSEYVFRIVRHGKSGSYDTTYEILLAGKLKGTSYEQILSENHATFPEYYNTIVKDMPANEMSSLINHNSTSSGSYSSTSNGGVINNYVVKPRQVSATPTVGVLAAAGVEDSSPSFDPVEDFKDDSGFEGVSEDDLEDDEVNF